jgi:hypothetical protein
MSTINDGGPAFPELDTGETHDNRDGGTFTSFSSTGGMSLRDYFAAAALTGIMANPERWKQIADDYMSGKKTYEQCSAANAVKAFSIADAMLAARATGASHG